MGIIKSLLVSAAVKSVNNHRMHFSSLAFGTVHSIRQMSNDRLVIIQNNANEYCGTVCRSAVESSLEDCVKKHIPAVFLCADIDYMKNIAARYADNQRVYMMGAAMADTNDIAAILSHCGCVCIYAPLSHLLQTEYVISQLIHLFEKGHLFDLISYGIQFPKKIKSILKSSYDGAALHFTAVGSSLSDFGCSIEHWSHSGGGILCLGISGADASFMINSVIGNYGKLQYSMNEYQGIIGGNLGSHNTSVNTDLLTHPPIQGGVYIDRARICRYTKILP